MVAFLLSGWLAGLRISEAMALRDGPSMTAPWVDFGSDRIWFPAAFSKSDEDEWVPLDPELREALLALPRAGGLVFALPSRQGGRMTRGGMSMRVGALARRAGVRLSMHGTRRGFVCFYAEREPAQVVQRLARHKSITTTAQHYVNVDRAAEAAVRERARANIPG
jgi:integrase